MAVDNILVKAEFDSEAQVWYVAETSLPGLNAEAASIEELIRLLPGMVQDLLEEEGSWEIGQADLPLEVVAHSKTIVRRAAA